MNSDDDPDDAGCILHVTILYASLEVWLRTTVDPTRQDRDRALSDLLADLALHLDHLSGQDLDSSPATFAAAERTLNVLDWFGIATNDVHSLLHLVASCTLQARDPEAVHTTARHTWERLRSATASEASDPITPALVIGDYR